MMKVVNLIVVYVLRLEEVIKLVVERKLNIVNVKGKEKYMNRDEL